jgi:hypothetical protein
VFSFCARRVSSIDLLSAAVLSVESICCRDVRLCGEHRRSDRYHCSSERVFDCTNRVAEATSKSKHPSALEVNGAAFVGRDALHHLLGARDHQWAHRYLFAIGSLCCSARKLFLDSHVPGGYVSSDGLIAVLAEFHKNGFWPSFGRCPSCKHSS